MTGVGLLVARPSLATTCVAGHSSEWPNPQERVVAIAMAGVEVLDMPKRSSTGGRAAPISPERKRCVSRSSTRLPSRAAVAP